MKMWGWPVCRRDIVVLFTSPERRYLTPTLLDAVPGMYTPYRPLPWICVQTALSTYVPLTLLMLTQIHFQYTHMTQHLNSKAVSAVFTYDTDTNQRHQVIAAVKMGTWLLGAEDGRSANLWHKDHIILRCADRSRNVSPQTEASQITLDILEKCRRYIRRINEM